MKTARKTKQQIIDELRQDLHNAGIRLGRNSTDSETRISELKKEVDKLNETDRTIRYEITKSLVHLMHGCSPQLTWPQIYIELGKLLQIKEFHYALKAEQNAPMSAC